MEPFPEWFETALRRARFAAVTSPAAIRYARDLAFRRRRSREGQGGAFGSYMRISAAGRIARGLAR
jgi:hypothetical protein